MSSFDNLTFFGLDLLFLSFLFLSLVEDLHLLFFDFSCWDSSESEEVLSEDSAYCFLFFFLSFEDDSEDSEVSDSSDELYRFLCFLDFLLSDFFLEWCFLSFFFFLDLAFSSSDCSSSDDVTYFCLLCFFLCFLDSLSSDISDSLTCSYSLSLIGSFL